MFSIKLFRKIFIYYQNMITNKLLLLSGSTFGILCIFCYNLLPVYFKLVLIPQSILTLMFWKDPIKNRNTILHRIDGFFVKLLVVSFISYKSFFYRKNFIMFAIPTGLGLYYFYLSDVQSRKEWCSQQHLIFHFLAHIFSCTSIFIAIQ